MKEGAGTASVHRVSPRTSADGTSSESTSVQIVTARATEATGLKRARHGQECNYNTMSIAPKGTASNNSEPLTRGDIPSLVQEIVNNLAGGTRAPSLDGGATSGNEGSILRHQGGSLSSIQSAEGSDRTSRINNKRKQLHGNSCMTKLCDIWFVNSPDSLFLE